MNDKLDRARDEAAIAFALLLGDLETGPRRLGLDGLAYTFDPDRRNYYDSKEQAAWMFLCELGYGIESNGTGIVKLSR